MDRMIGTYLGTVINRRWRPRYRRRGFLHRGHGEYWFDRDGLSFRRFQAKTPMHIPYDAMCGVRNVSWHAWRWAPGKQIVCVTWIHEGQHLSSGFIFANNQPGDHSMTRSMRRRRASHSAPTPTPA
jgi:hypothetical protein